MNPDTRNKLKALVMKVINEAKAAKAKKSLKVEKSDKMKTAKLPKNNTQMKAVSEKKITSTSAPKEKVEGKKLPVVKKPAPIKGKGITESSNDDTYSDYDPNDFDDVPKKDYGGARDVTKKSLYPDEDPNLTDIDEGKSTSLKSVVMQMIKEELEQEYRTKGALGAKNANRTEPVKSYTPKGNVGMGRPATVPSTSVLVSVNGKSVGEFDLSAKLPSGKPDTTPLEKRVRTFIYNNPDMAAYGLNPSVIAAFDKLSDLEIDGQLTDSNRKVNLRVQNGELVV